MTRLDPHPVLSRPTADALVLLADPERSATVPLPALTAVEADDFVRAAWAHGTMSTARRHLRARTSATEVSPPFMQRVLAEEENIVAAVGEGLRLRHWGERLARHFRDEGIPAALVKGSVFASRLYRHASDRMFSDVDIVVAPGALDAVSTALRDLGFVRYDIEGHDAEEHREFKWIMRSAPPLSQVVHAEVHTDLIHSARQRRRASVGYEAISAAGAGDAADATALLFVACIHASLGHQFERLQLVIDVLQGARAPAGAVDVERLGRVSERSGTRRAVAAALAVTGRIMRDSECAALSRTLMPGAGSLERLLVSRRVVVAAQSIVGRRVAWRRKLFRRLAIRPAPSAAGAAREAPR